MFRSIAVVAGVVAALLPPGNPAAHAAAPPPPPTGEIVITVVKAQGSGCKPRTTAVAISPDREAFTVTYSDYLAQVGVGARPADSRKDCRLRLKLDVPRGYTYAIVKADYRGFAHLERGATGLETANYHFHESAETAPVTHRYNGPFEDNWEATDTAQVVYAPCNRTRHLNINTELRVSAGTSNPNSTTSFMSMDSTDGSFDTKYHFAWRQCS
jgi:hypothetical protein